MYYTLNVSNTFECDFLKIVLKVVKSELTFAESLPQNIV